MSKNAVDRLVFKAMRAKIAGMILNAVELKKTTDILKDLAVNSTDMRVRHHSCETLRANHLKAVDQNIHMYEYENPQVQKSEMELKGLPIPPSKLTVRIISSDQGKKSNAANKR